MKAAALALMIAATVTGCSAIAGRGPGPARCEITDGVDPCLLPARCVEGACIVTCVVPETETCDSVDNDCDGNVDEATCAAGRCVNNVCRADCTPEEVLCDRRDDDCDGMVDENLSGDQDGDMYSACPLDGTLLDCNDRNAGVNPSVREICNGLDDDCDPSTMESSVNECATGLGCLVPPGESVPRCVDPRDCTQFPCPTGEICNADSDCCTPGVDTGCGVVGDCTTMGCPTNARCLPDTMGGGFSCVEFGRIGDACTRGSDCDSGRCYQRAALDLPGADGICGVACCSNDDCAADQACWAPGTGARSCVPRALLGETPPEACTRNAECSDGVCGAHSYDVPTGGLGSGWTCGPSASGTCGSRTCGSGLCAGSTCVTPCGESARDCPFSFETQQACVYYRYASDWISGCGTPGGIGRQGDDCGFGCYDRLCFSGECVDVCCNDGDCSGGTVCTPYDNAGWEMRCLPRSGVGPG